LRDRLVVVSQCQRVGVTVSLVGHQVSPISCAIRWTTGQGPGRAATTVRAAGAQRAAVDRLVFVEKHFQGMAGVFHVVPAVGEKGVVVGAAGGMAHVLQPCPEPVLHGEARGVGPARGECHGSAAGSGFGVAASSIAAHTGRLLGFVSVVSGGRCGIGRGFTMACVGGEIDPPGRGVLAT